MTLGRVVWSQKWDFRLSKTKIITEVAKMQLSLRFFDDNVRIYVFHLHTGKL